jgi:hypothetical protein
MYFNGLEGMRKKPCRKSDSTLHLSEGVCGSCVMPLTVCVRLYKAKPGAAIFLDTHHASVDQSLFRENPSLRFPVFLLLDSKMTRECS